MDLSTDFSTFQKAVTDALLASTRTASQLASEDLSFHRSSSNSFSSSLDAQNVRLLHLTNRLLKAAASDAHTDVHAPQLNNIDSVDDKWRSVVDVVDDLLEKADRSIDEFTGVIKRSSPKRDVGEGKPREKHGASVAKPRFFSTLTKKPQQHFERKVDNFETGPWRPLLKSKPHSKEPLEEVPGSVDVGYKHPYAEEITNYKYPERIYRVSSPIPFSPPEESEAVFVDTEEGVAQMLEDLKQADAIAVDLEHHDMHSYVGLVCLMQISTRNKDWIVDTLKPWRENLQILNEVFADPRIIKVFHGSTFDIIWLQRDLGLYVVGLFDTFYAANALSFPKRSLKYLLERFANFDAQKIYQTSDWRVRPLPVELVDYARSDTHYLLHVFDQVRNMLIEASTPESNLIDYVREQSKKEALQRYQRPVYDRERGLGSVGWYGPLSKRSVRFTNEQFGAFRLLHEWRDDEARKLDESPAAILGLNALFAIAYNMPTSTPALLSTTNPISKSVRDNSDHILELIKRGREESKGFPPFWDVMQQNDALKKQRKPWERETPATVKLSAGTAKAEVTEVPRSVSARSKVSGLWGRLMNRFLKTKEEAWEVVVVQDTFSRIMPVPSGAAPLNVPVEEHMAATPTKSQGTAIASTPKTAPHDRNDDIFTLKDLKLQEASRQLMEDEADADIITIDPEKAAKAERKARRKEEKRLEKLAQKPAAAKAGGSALQESQNGSVTLLPFDYANAPSVLHSIADSPNPLDSGKANKKRPFDPYAKAMEGPRAAKQAKREEQGKSFTFRN